MICCIKTGLVGIRERYGRAAAAKQTGSFLFLLPFVEQADNEAAVLIKGFRAADIKLRGPSSRQSTVLSLGLCRPPEWRQWRQQRGRKRRIKVGACGGGQCRVCFGCATLQPFPLLGIITIIIRFLRSTPDRSSMLQFQVHT